MILKDKLNIIEESKLGFDYKRVFNLVIGLLILVFFYFFEIDYTLTDSTGEQHFFDKNVRLSLGILFMACYWWISEVIPVGVTALLIGIFQIVLGIREFGVVYSSYSDAGVLFIFASLIFGITFTKTGLSKRITYFILAKIPFKPFFIYFGSFLIIFILTLFMTHTASAAASFSIFLSIDAFFGKNNPKFSRNLFLGIAIIASVSSIATLFGSARGVVGIDLYYQITGDSIRFMHYSKYLFPLSFILLILGTLYFYLLNRKKIDIVDKSIIKSNVLYLKAGLGKIRRNEILTIAITLFTILGIISLSFIDLKLEKTTILLFGACLFFILNILTIKDLESIPWNIFLLFGGSLNLGYGLWESGGANYIALVLIELIPIHNEFMFYIFLGILSVFLSNFVMNVAALSILLPIFLKIAEYLDYPLINTFFVSVACAGFAFILLTGSAPNMIAYQSGRFKIKDLAFYGFIFTIVCITVTCLFAYYIW